MTGFFAMFNEVVNKIVFGKAERLFAALPVHCVDFTVTSPPYKYEDGYSGKLMLTMFEELYRVHRPNSYMFFNFGHLVNFKERPMYLVGLAVRCGWQLHDTIIWEKPQFTPSTSAYHLNNIFEYVFVFRKGQMLPLDRLALGIPYKDKSNISRYGDGKDLRCGGNIWRFGYPTIQKETDKVHPHRFPAELPMRCLRLVRYHLNERTVIADPFGGGFTTAEIALCCGCHFISSEINLQHCLGAAARLKKPLYVLK